MCNGAACTVQAGWEGTVWPRIVGFQRGGGSAGLNAGLVWSGRGAAGLTGILFNSSIMIALSTGRGQRGNLASRVF